MFYEHFEQKAGLLRRRIKYHCMKEKHTYISLAQVIGKNDGRCNTKHRTNSMRSAAASQPWRGRREHNYIELGEALAALRSVGSATHQHRCRANAGCPVCYQVSSIHGSKV